MRDQRTNEGMTCEVSHSRSNWVWCSVCYIQSQWAVLLCNMVDQVCIRKPPDLDGWYTFRCFPCTGTQHFDAGGIKFINTLSRTPDCHTLICRWWFGRGGASVLDFIAAFNFIMLDMNKPHIEFMMRVSNFAHMQNCLLFKNRMWGILLWILKRASVYKWQKDSMTFSHLRDDHHLHCVFSSRYIFYSQASPVFHLYKQCSSLSTINLFFKINLSQSER